MKAEAHSHNYSNINDDENGKLYLIHHMHHFLKNDEIKHELHHCFLFSEKDKKGKKFSIQHKLVEDDLFHCLVEKYEDILYDHLNNEFKIKTEELDKEVIYKIDL